MIYLLYGIYFVVWVTDYIFPSFVNSRERREYGMNRVTTVVRVLKLLVKVYLSRIYKQKMIEERSLNEGTRMDGWLIGSPAGVKKKRDGTGCMVMGVEDTFRRLNRWIPWPLNKTRTTFIVWNESGKQQWTFLVIHDLLDGSGTDSASARENLRVIVEWTSSDNLWVTIY